MIPLAIGMEPAITHAMNTVSPAPATTGPLVETSGGWAGPIAMVIVTLLVVAAAGGLIWAFVTGYGSVDTAPVWAQALAVLILSVVVVLMTSGAVTLVRRQLRFGPSALTLDQRETPPGGVLSGQLNCHLALDAVPRFDIELQCLETVRSRSASSSKGGDDTTTTQVWADEYECLGEASVEMPGGTLVPIRFAIPAAARETTTGGYPQIAWKLRITSPQPGLDFISILPVIVRSTAPPWSGSVRTPRPVPDDQRPSATMQSAWSDDGQELEIRFGRARNPTFA